MWTNEYIWGLYDYMGLRTPIWGHARGQIWYRWIPRVGFPISV